jgi:cysteinyl-tRNA synthetase
MNSARAALRRIDALVSRLRHCPEGRETKGTRGLVDEMIASFEAAMEADLNTPLALASVFILIRKINQQLAAAGVTRDDASLIIDAFAKVNSVLAVFDLDPEGIENEDQEIEALVSEREEARENKNYDEADRIRETLKKRNVVLEDTAYGTLYWIENRPVKA